MTTPNAPKTVIYRGQDLVVRYTKNNHHGGLLRLSLVPVRHMYSLSWHKNLTLMHGCWESGEYKCQTGDCGTDKNQDAFQRTIRIPTVFPDGEYVLGYVWYGGLHFKRDYGFFPDFFSCAFVTVKGGEALGGTYKAYFEPGQGRRIVGGKCDTSSDAVGVCGNTGCVGTRAFRAIPRIFRDNGIRSITPNELRNENERDDTGDSGGGDDKDNGVGAGNESGICNRSVCCATSCMKCGGSGCHRRKGGGKNCCMGRIRESGRICGRDPAPCIKK